MKIGKDGKVREVNIAYKVMTEDEPGWRHNVVVRPATQCVKLFEIEDTSYAENMKDIRNLAKQILMGNEETAVKIAEQTGKNISEIINIQDDEVESDKTKMLQEMEIFFEKEKNCHK